MASWNDVFSRLGLSRVGEQLLAAVRPSIRLSGIEHAESADHRLGGRPNLPHGFHWPAYKEQPLAFLAQLDLAALPAVDGIDLPRTGVLYFFWGGMEMACGFSPNDRGAWHENSWDQHCPAPTQRLSGYPSWCNTAKLKSDFDKHRPFGTPGRLPRLHPARSQAQGSPN